MKSKFIRTMFVFNQTSSTIQFGDPILIFGCKHGIRLTWICLHFVGASDRVFISPSLLFEAKLTTLKRLSESVIKIITLPGCKQCGLIFQLYDITSYRLQYIRYAFTQSSFSNGK